MRIRSIKPEFWTHPVMSRQSDATKLLAIALLNVADDEGYFYADPVLLRNSVRPFDETTEIIRRSLVELSTIKYIAVHVHPTHGPIGRVISFRKHQSIDRARKSDLTRIFDEASSSASVPVDEASPRRAVDEGSTRAQRGNGMDPGNGMEPGKGRDPKGNLSAPSLPAAPSGSVGDEPVQPSKTKTPEEIEKARAEAEARRQISEQAIELYNLYPRHEGRDKALPKIERAIREVGVDPLREAVQAYRDATDRWPSADRVYIPQPAAWFHQGRWADDRSLWARSGAPEGARGLAPGQVVNPTPIKKPVFRTPLLGSMTKEDSNG